MGGEAAALFWRAEVEAERTVGALRVLVGLVLGGIFLGVVVGRAPDHVLLERQIRLASLTILAYTAAGAAAWRLAGSRFFRPWMPWLFATLDVAFLVVAVLFGMLNLGVPPGYVASYPAIWLAPVVLTFGALRYNPWLQGYLTAALGLGLVAVVGLAGLLEDPTRRAPPEIVAFLAGTPPNMMRLAMVALAGAMLILAARRARGLVRRAIEETRRRAALGRYLPPEIADRLASTSAAELRRGRRQPVAILFADIRGFTLRAEGMDPAALGAFVGEFRGCVTRAAAGHGGVIDKFIGDAAMVLFGVPQPRPDDAGRALACARALHAEVEVWNAVRAAAGEDRIEVAVGLHYGEVFVGAIGDDSRLEFTVLGDAVNVAARIAETTKATGEALLVSQDLLDAAGDGDGWRPLPARRLRGRQRPVTLLASV